MRVQPLVESTTPTYHQATNGRVHTPVAVILRYLTFAWVTLFMHVLATVGHKVSNYRKYSILVAAEEVVRGGF